MKRRLKSWCLLGVGMLFIKLLKLVSPLATSCIDMERASLLI